MFRVRALVASLHWDSESRSSSTGHSCGTDIGFRSSVTTSVTERSRAANLDSSSCRARPHQNEPTYWRSRPFFHRLRGQIPQGSGNGCRITSFNRHEAVDRTIQVCTVSGTQLHYYLQCYLLLLSMQEAKKIAIVILFIVIIIVMMISIFISIIPIFLLGYKCRLQGLAGVSFHRFLCC